MHLALLTVLFFLGLLSTWAYGITLIRDIIHVKGKGNVFLVLVSIFAWTMFFMVSKL